MIPSRQRLAASNTPEPEFPVVATSRDRGAETAAQFGRNRLGRQNPGAGGPLGCGDDDGFARIGRALA